jgi:hypothetical protein
MPLQQTSGNVTADAYGGGVAVEPNYIEDVMSTFLYTGNGSTQTITNGIDLSGKGGLVWVKGRSAAWPSELLDTTRPVNQYLTSSATYGSTVGGTGGSFNSNGITFPNDAWLTNSSDTYASWTFRKQPKFFDVVTYTGNGTTNQNISHNLGSVPGCIIIKKTSNTSKWFVGHQGLDPTFGSFLALNETSAAYTQPTYNKQFTSTPTSTLFSVTNAGACNASGDTYVAYLFAHNAGGFGLTGTDNVISCGSGSWSGGSDNVVNLGYEPQWLMYKPTDAVGNWMMYDVMRGMSLTASEFLRANLSDAAGTYNSPYAIYPNATGFTVPAGLVSTGNYIYIAIRRGPMKVPTDATKVFSPLLRTGTGSAVNVSTGFPPDLVINANTNKLWSANNVVFDRLRGADIRLSTNNTNAETTDTGALTAFNNTTFSIGSGTVTTNTSTYPYINWAFGRSPSFFDEVCYTGNSIYGRQLTHNLAVSPQLLIVKARSGPVNQNWQVCYNNNGSYVQFNNTNAGQISDNWFPDNGGVFFPTYVRLGAANGTNNVDYTYVAYLFATAAGVSKVGSYTGNGTTQTINCGFTGGARFVLIKRTDSTGDWYVYDTARGMTTTTDPYLLLNSTAAETATLGSVTTVSTGFALNSAILAAINVNAGTYIFLAIA